MANGKGGRPTKYKGEFALYKGERFITYGTIEDIATERGVKVASIKYLLTNAYKNKNRNFDNAMALVPLDYDIEDETA